MKKVTGIVSNSSQFDSRGRMTMKIKKNIFTEHLPAWLTAVRKGSAEDRRISVPRHPIGQRTGILVMTH